MPQYGKPTGRDTIENLIKRIDELENTVKRLSGSPHRSAFDRGDTASVAAPIEGQTLIQYDTDSPHYYANGAWHSFTGTSSPVSWAHLTSADESTVAAGATTGFTCYSTGLITNDTATFDVYQAGTAEDGGLAILAAGVYEIEFELIALSLTANVADPTTVMLQLGLLTDSTHVGHWAAGTGLFVERVYGEVIQNASAGTDTGQWRARLRTPVGGDSVSSSYVKPTAKNMSSSSWTPDGFSVRITAVRLSDVPAAGLARLF